MNGNVHKSNMEKLKNSPAVRDKNIKLSLAVIASIDHDDIPLLMCALLGKWQRVQLDMALDTAQRMLGKSPTVGQQK